MRKLEDFFVPEIDMMVVVGIESVSVMEHGREHEHNFVVNPSFVSVSVNSSGNLKMASMGVNMIVNIGQDGMESLFLSPKRFRQYMQEQLTCNLASHVLATPDGMSTNFHKVTEVIEHGPAIQIRFTSKEELPGHRQNIFSQ